MAAPTTRAPPFANQHVMITGGSEGLGLALAKQLVARHGARVTLVARTPSKLQAAAEAVVAAASGERPRNGAAAAGGGNQQQQQPAAAAASQVFVHAADVTKYEQVVAAVQAAEAAHGPVDVLICCAGAAELGYFHELDPAVFEAQMRLNYLGSVWPAKALATDMLRRNAGHIVLVGSALSLLGMVGYSAYCPSKFAVRGLAECLRNEFQGSRVRVSVAYPADISTPGYQRENLSKPPETLKLSEGKLFSPEKVASDLLRGLAGGDFILPNSSFLVGLLQTITAGLVPRRALALAWQAVLGALSPLICSVVAAEHDGVAAKGATQRFARLWKQGQAAGAGQ